MSDGGRRILIYSHDSYGLGHLRRCRAIAQSLASYQPNASILILTGSPVAGSFGFPRQVDFIRVPGVEKLGDERYGSHSLGMDIRELLSIRSAIIQRTAETFRPDLFLVDKEPLGLRSEVEPALAPLKRMGSTLVLGLRDVMDEPGRLSEEWERKRALPAIESLYDQIWVYGLPEICDPLQGIELSEAAREKVRFTGYIRRIVQPSGALPQPPDVGIKPYVLVTTGGGGDGAALVDWVLRAYEHDPELSMSAVIVLGPFMEASQRNAFLDRAARDPRLRALVFEASIEPLIDRAVGIVAMGGYNTFCEILSFDKRAVVVPRTSPRLEQHMRISRAAEIGLVRMLLPGAEADPMSMADAIRALPSQAPPSAFHVPGLLDGLSVINGLVEGTATSAAPTVLPFAPRPAAHEG